MRALAEFSGSDLLSREHVMESLSGQDFSEMLAKYLVERGGRERLYALADAAVKLAERPKLFLAIGTEDPLYRFNLAFHDHLREIGYDHVWYTHEGQHNFDFWNDALQAFFAWQDKNK